MFIFIVFLISRRPQVYPVSGHLFPYAASVRSSGLAGLDVAAQRGVKGAAIVDMRQRVDLHLLAGIVERLTQFGHCASQFTRAAFGLGLGNRKSTRLNSSH